MRISINCTNHTFTHSEFVLSIFVHNKTKINTEKKTIKTKLLISQQISLEKQK